MALEEDIARLRREAERLQDHLVEGSLMLVDLAGSTAYKTAQPQEVWLPRLVDFRSAVERAIAPARPTKYLGDGILLFVAADAIEPAKFLTFAERIYSNLSETNQRYTSEHVIAARIVLGYGPVFRFDGTDPQGSAVDKLFRLEKYVPNGCIGMSSEFRNRTQTSNVRSAGFYRLKGLTHGLHELFLLDRLDPASLAVLDELQQQVALRDLWDLGMRGTGQISVITGYIPPETDGADTIEMGDKDALVGAVINIAKVGRIGDLKVLTCHEATDSDLRENVICIGGPYYNSITLQFMQEIKSPFIFDMSDPEGDRTPIHKCLEGGENYESQWTGARLTHDWGFFGRFTNPYNSDRHVILACGIETSGVSGIVKAFGAENPHLLGLHQAIRARSHGRTDLADFFCLMKFRVEKNGMPRLLSRDDQLREITTGWIDNHNGQTQQEAVLE